MSRDVARRYRVRIAQRGASEVEGSVEFTLDVPPLAAIPVVAGSLVHPLQGATDLRPLHILAVDHAGSLIQAFTLAGRWAALGRLLDIQFQTEGEAEWTTYGTGRCSGLDEAEGPGLFRVEVSDESWIARRSNVFAVADTTQIWPSGVRWAWRGFPPTPAADAEVTDTDTDQNGRTIYRLRMSAGQNASGSTRGRDITDTHRQWVTADRKSEGAWFQPGKGNWTHLRVRYGGRDWEVVSFGIATVAVTLDQPVVSGGGSGLTVTINVWVIGDDPAPPGSGTAYFYAPTAAPSRAVPLHLGVGNEEHPWGTGPQDGLDPDLFNVGWFHPADLSRRVWEALGVRYDEANLAALEEDLSFPAIAPWVEAAPDDVERWMQEEVWGPNMLLALKDPEGRRKLVDLRPPADEELGDLPVLNAVNSKHHRWRLVGAEMVNSIHWEYTAMQSPFPIEGAWFGWWNDEQMKMLQPPTLEYAPFGEITATTELVPGPGDPAIEPDSLDNIIKIPAVLGPFESDAANEVGVRPITFKAHASLEPLDTTVVGAIARSFGIFQRGSIWRFMVGPLSEFLLQVYQDGPQRGTCELGASLAETLAEGDFAVLDCESIKIPNAGQAARFGTVLVLMLSLTRHPAHAECEYLVVRPILIFQCPTPDDPSTWLVSAPGEEATIRIALSGIVEPGSETLSLNLRARKHAAGGQRVDLALALYQGSTQIAAWLEEDITHEFVTYAFELTLAQLAEITDFGDLAIEISRFGETDGAPEDQRRLEISRIGAANPQPV